MPPLPSAPSDIYPSITRRLDDIDTFQIPRLAKCAGPISLQRELAEETKGDLEQVRRNIEVSSDLSGDARG
jgi:protein transport protein SEC20